MGREQNFFKLSKDQGAVYMARGDKGGNIVQLSRVEVQKASRGQGGGNCPSGWNRIIQGVSPNSFGIFKGMVIISTQATLVHGGRSQL